MSPFNYVRSNPKIFSGRAHPPYLRVCKVDSKTNKVRAAWAGGNRIRALRVPARFFDCSEAKKAFKRGLDAHNNPDFYRQLGKDPAQIVADALNTLVRRFAL
jgi:hypothetical protein